MILLIVAFYNDLRINELSDKTSEVNKRENVKNAKNASSNER